MERAKCFGGLSRLIHPGLVQTLMYDIEHGYVATPIEIQPID